jgi:hypothetical protein
MLSAYLALMDFLFPVPSGLEFAQALRSFRCSLLALPALHARWVAPPEPAPRLAFQFVACSLMFPEHFRASPRRRAPAYASLRLVQIRRHPCARRRPTAALAPNPRPATPLPSLLTSPSCEF